MLCMLLLLLMRMLFLLMRMVLLLHRNRGATHQHAWPPTCCTASSACWIEPM